MTNKRILKELEKKDFVLIIVQEEDFLRPDTSFTGNKEEWRDQIKLLYDALAGDAATEGMNFKLGISYSGSWDTGIRRCGWQNKNKESAFPRMHNKFLLCFDQCYGVDEDGAYIIPEYGNKIGKDGCVITGSYNYTENSNNSLENIVCIKNEEVLNAYVEEFKQITVMSMPLNWNTEWTPNNNELRYGT